MLCTLLLVQAAKAAVFTVTTTADSGPGSLRQAILDANATPGADMITFLIPVAGNRFEGSGANTYAVIELATVLPTITEAVVIDGSTQPNTNIGSIAGQTVGVDAIAQPSIAYPDVYIVPAAGFVFPAITGTVSGNGLSVDATGVTLRAIAISGFGNTSSNSGNASSHADVAVLRSNAARSVNMVVEDCFVSCDPMGTFSALAHRRTKGVGILVAGNNQMGSITRNYLAYSGTYGIYFNGNVDNLNVGPAGTVLGNNNWIISGNQLHNITTNDAIAPNSLTRICDAINLMKCVNFQVFENYIYNADQMGIDLGYNSDFNYLDNNTITGFTRTSAYLVQAGIRVGLSSEGNTLEKNLIYNNTGSNFKGGVYMDRTKIALTTGVVEKDNKDNVIQLNHIYNNAGSGVVLSSFYQGPAPGACYDNTISRNQIHNHTGLGIDLDFDLSANETLVNVNDDGDGDVGTNTRQNFPILDSVRRVAANTYAFYGKAPAGATVEVFLNDGGVNNHGGLLLNYGEGRAYIGSFVEGGAADLRTGTDSYSVDGNVSTNNSNLFAVTLTYTGTVTSTDYITATATVGKNTSEFGPLVPITIVTLDCKLTAFTASLNKQDVLLDWKAICNNDFRSFEVEHSTNGRSFTTMATVLPMATGVETIFSYRHQSVAGGDHWYRLKMIGKTGKASYSTLQRVVVKQGSGELAHLPTVFGSQLSLRIQAAEAERINVTLYHSNGALLRQQQYTADAGWNQLQVKDLGNLPAGTYILQVRKQGESQTRKLIKQ